MTAASVMSATIWQCSLLLHGASCWHLLLSSLQGLAADKQRRSAVRLQAGSLEFLANQGFDFNKFVYEGVPLLRASDRDRHLSRMDAGDSAPPRPDIPLDKPENRELVDRLIAQVAEWLKVRGTLCPHSPHSSTPQWPCDAGTSTASCEQGLCFHTTDSHFRRLSIVDLPLKRIFGMLLESRNSRVVSAG